jgi:hypothetical protein
MILAGNLSRLHNCFAVRQACPLVRRRRPRVCTRMSATKNGESANMYGGNAQKKLFDGMLLNGQTITVGGITPKSMPKFSCDNFGTAYPEKFLGTLFLKSRNDF